MNKECLICNAPLANLLQEEPKECAVCHMHGPEHHVMAGAALVTACKNAGSKLDLENALIEMYNRGKAVSGGACGFLGACGAGIRALEKDIRS